MSKTTFSAGRLRQLEMLRLESRKKFLGSRQGGHISLKKGHGIEFSDYRQYQPGDNPRHIDWKVYGRSDKLYVKRSQEEQEFLVSIFLDTSPSMGLETEPDKWAYSRDLALSFAYLGLLQQDKVIVHLLGQNRAIAASGAQGFWQISRELENFEDKYESSASNSSFTRSLQQASMRVKFPGIGIVISDFHFDLAQVHEGFKTLLGKNLEIIAIQILGQQDLQPVSVEETAELMDSENSDIFNFQFNKQNSSQLADLIKKHSLKCRDFFSHHQIGFSVFPTDTDFLTLLSRSGDALKIIR